MNNLVVKLQTALKDIKKITESDVDPWAKNLNIQHICNQLRMTGDLTARKTIRCRHGVNELNRCNECD